ncbi:MAG TPA: thioesterase family protein [Solirubrobacterales bacterium]
MGAPDRDAVALDAATELEGADGAYSARLSDAWEIWGPSGGYLAALTLRAAGEVAVIPRPVSYYCHFLSPPGFDRVELAVESLKQGRRSEALAVRMTQGGRDIMLALVRTAAEGPGYRHQEIEAPAVDGPEASPTVERLADDGSPLYAFWNNVACRRPAVERTGGESPALIREWVRFEPVGCFEDPFVDAARPLILLDTFGWPAVWMKHRGADFVAPNLDTAVWFHRPRSASEWLLVDHRSPVAGDGLIGVSGRVWDTEGGLLASGGAQLYSIPRA